MNRISIRIGFDTPDSVNAKELSALIESFLIHRAMRDNTLEGVYISAEIKDATATTQH